jgi:hypothetical protein
LRAGGNSWFRELGESPHLEIHLILGSNKVADTVAGGKDSESLYNLFHPSNIGLFALQRTRLSTSVLPDAIDQQNLSTLTFCFSDKALDISS